MSRSSLGLSGPPIEGYKGNYLCDCPPGVVSHPQTPQHALPR